MAGWWELQTKTEPRMAATKAPQTSWEMPRDVMWAPARSMDSHSDLQPAQQTPMGEPKAEMWDFLKGLGSYSADYWASSTQMDASMAGLSAPTTLLDCRMASLLASLKWKDEQTAPTRAPCSSTGWHWDLQPAHQTRKGVSRAVPLANRTNSGSCSAALLAPLKWTDDLRAGSMEQRIQMDLDLAAS